MDNVAMPVANLEGAPILQGGIICEPRVLCVPLFFFNKADQRCLA
jgi:hypothetical protein